MLTVKVSEWRVTPKRFFNAAVWCTSSYIAAKENEQQYQLNIQRTENSDAAIKIVMSRQDVEQLILMLQTRLKATQPL